MMNVEKCPNCGAEVTSENRRGNWLRCPHCKTSFEITLKVGKKLGMCPHGCGETLKDYDYDEKNEILDCPHCSRKSINKGDTEHPILLKYAGKCPSCGNLMSEKDAVNKEYVCPICGSHSLQRSDYQMSLVTFQCPKCLEPLCDEDVSERNIHKCSCCHGLVIVSSELKEPSRCPHCGGSKFVLKRLKECPSCHEVYHVDPKGNHGGLCGLPGIDLESFKKECFNLWYDLAPADIGNRLCIVELKRVLLPFNGDKPAFSGVCESILHADVDKRVEFYYKDKVEAAMFSHQLFDMQSKAIDNSAMPHPAWTYDVQPKPKSTGSSVMSYPVWAYSTVPVWKVSSDFNIEFSGSESAAEYKPFYYMKYTYDDNSERYFYMLGEDCKVGRIFAVNFPLESKLLNENWFPERTFLKGYLAIVALTLCWWYNLSDGFFSGLWYLILATIGSIIACVIYWNILAVQIGERMKTSCQKRKKEDFDKIHDIKI